MKRRRFQLDVVLRNGMDFCQRWYADEGAPHPKYTEVTCNCGQVWNSFSPAKEGEYRGGIPQFCDCGRKLR